MSKANDPYILGTLSVDQNGVKLLEGVMGRCEHDDMREDEPVFLARLLPGHLCILYCRPTKFASVDSAVFAFAQAQELMTSSKVALVHATQNDRNLSDHFPLFSGPFVP